MTTEPYTATEVRDLTNKDNSVSSFLEDVTKRIYFNSQKR